MTIEDIIQIQQTSGSLFTINSCEYLLLKKSCNYPTH